MFFSSGLNMTHILPFCLLLLSYMVRFKMDHDLSSGLNMTHILPTCSSVSKVRTSLCSFFRAKLYDKIFFIRAEHNFYVSELNIAHISLPLELSILIKNMNITCTISFGAKYVYHIISVINTNMDCM